MLLFLGGNPNKVAQELLVNLLEGMLVWEIVRVVLPIFNIYFIIILSSYLSKIEPHNGQNSGYHTPIQNTDWHRPQLLRDRILGSIWAKFQNLSHV